MGCNSQIKLALAKLVVLLAMPISLWGCDSYWWTRGQPPSAEELVTRSTRAFEQAAKKANRKDIEASANSLKDSLVRAYENSEKNDFANLKSAVDTALDRMLELEKEVAVTTRPAMAELGSQLRAFEGKLESGELLDSPQLGTFTSRVLFLLADEMSIPAAE